MCKICNHSVCIPCDNVSNINWVKIKGREYLLCLNCRLKIPGEKQNGARKANETKPTETTSDGHVIIYNYF